MSRPSPISVSGESSSIDLTTDTDEMAEVIDLDTDTYIDRIDLTFEFDRAESLAPNFGLPADVGFEGDAMSERDFKVWIANQKRMSTAINSRINNTAASASLIVVDSYVHNQVSLRERKTVEFASGEFMRIIQVLRDKFTNQVFLKGILYQRMKFMGGTMEKKMNEVLQIINVDDSDPRSLEEQAVRLRSATEVVRKRNLVLTNQPYPALSFRGGRLESQGAIMNGGVLVARWRYICRYRDAATLRKGIHTSEKALLALREEECDPHRGIKDVVLHSKFRGNTDQGGAHYDHQTATADYKAEQRLKETKLSHDRPSFQNALASSSQSVIDLTNDDNALMEVDTVIRKGKRKAEKAELSSSKRKHSSFSTLSQSKGSASTSKSRIRSPSLECLEQGLEHFSFKHKQQNTRSPEHSTASKFSANAAIGTDLFDKSGLRYRRYTYGDGFSGCGGTARGAGMAGIFHKWAFDFEEDMCSSYKMNFPTSRVFCTEFFNFATQTMDYNIKVDIMHLSPPCNFYSPAHTLPGQHDERNVAASFGLQEILNKAKPRIVTLENTLGLQQRHPLYLNAIIQQFTCNGFSVRWGIIDLRDFGLPQSRKRLIIIAACPGEVLPEMPKPTHSQYAEDGLQQWTTINQSIGNIPIDCIDHDTENYIVPRQSYNGDTQSKCITTNGGNNIHPSGRRPFTVRELACLQTFPHDHIFVGSKTSQKKQVGNAVPPVFYKALAQEIVRILRKSDGIEQTSGSPPSEPVLIE